MEDEWKLNFERKAAETSLRPHVDLVCAPPAGPLLIPSAGVGPGSNGKSIVELYSRMRPSLRAYLGARGLNKEHSEDVIQEVFLRLVREKFNLHSDENWRAWVFRVAHNLAMDHHRSEKRRQMGNELELHLVQHDRLDPSPDPEQKLLHEERIRNLQMALSQLTPKQRNCVRLRARGLRYQEIACAMGVSVQRVGDLIQRAISRVDPKI